MDELSEESDDYDSSNTPTAAMNLINHREMLTLINGRKLCDNIVTAAMRLIMRFNPLVEIQPNVHVRSSQSDTVFTH